MSQLFNRNEWWILMSDSRCCFYYLLSMLSPGLTSEIYRWGFKYRCGTVKHKSHKLTSSELLAELVSFSTLVIFSSQSQSQSQHLQIDCIHNHKSLFNQQGFLLPKNHTTTINNKQSKDIHIYYFNNKKVKLLNYSRFYSKNHKQAVCSTLSCINSSSPISAKR